MPYVSKKRSKKRGFHVSRKIQNIGLLALVFLVTLGALFAFMPRHAAPVAEPVTSAKPEPGPTYEGPVLTLPKKPSVLIMGDSFTQGYGADNEKSEGYAYVLADLMKWDDVTYSGLGGTGFIKGNIGDNRPYAERLRLLAMDEEFAPDLIILQGGINDVPFKADELEAATKVALDTINREWEDAQTVVLGPVTYRDGSHVNRGYKAAAGDAGAAFVAASGRNTWLPKKTELYAEDGWHPSTLGHKAMAEGIAKELNIMISEGKKQG